MKTEINKSVKRALSMVIAVALLLGTLFTANVGVNIKADATTGSGKKVVYANMNPDGSYTSNGSGTEADPYIISTTGQLRHLVQNSTTASSAGNFYKIDPSIDIMVMQTENYIEDVAGSLDAFLALDAEGTKTALSTTANRQQWQSASSASNYDGFAGNIDFSGVTICGMYNANGGLFALARGATFKNLTLSNNYITSTWYNGNLVGMVRNASGAAQETLTIDRVVVRNCYQTTTGNGYSNTGVLIGTTLNSYNIAHRITNILTYGNISKGQTSSSDTTMADCALYGSLSTTWNGFGSDFENAYFEDIVTLDCVPYPTANINNQTTRPKYWHDSIYTTHYNASYRPNSFEGGDLSSITAIKQISEEDAKGVRGRLTMMDLNWATDSADGDWYAIEGEYPTLFRPDGWTDVDVPSFFTGTAAAAFAGGDGTKANPYLIETPDQLYKMVTSSGKDAEGNQLYYKVADGVEKLYINNIYLNESLAGIKALVSGGSYKNWSTTTEFFGNFDGNGVVISGMVSYNANAFIAKMSGSSVVKNVRFENCYAYGDRAAMVTTSLGAYNAGTNKPFITNVSVRNSRIESTRAQGYYERTVTSSSYSVTEGDYTYKAGNETAEGSGKYYVVNQTTGNKVYDAWGATAGGIVSTNDTATLLTISNCLFDGYSCELLQPNGTIDISAGIISMPSGGNNYSITGCVSFGAPIVSTGVGANGEEIYYNRYNTKGPYTATILNCYSDLPYRTTNKAGAEKNTYWNIYDRPAQTKKVDTKNTYAISEFALLDWGSMWALETFDNGKTIPMPCVNKADESVFAYSSYIDMISKHNGVGLLAGTHPYQNGKYGWYSELTGSGTEADPYIIDSAEKLAIAIATGGLHYEHKLYYKLGCDIELNSLPWITNTSTGTEYSYVPFEGTLDGDGHVVSGLSATNENDVAGLIPELNGGTVKNLHIRNSYAASSIAPAGIFVGNSMAGNIEGCSIEDSHVINSSNNFVGAISDIAIKNSYYIDGSSSSYYVADGSTQEPTDFYSATNLGGAWYKGNDGTARLVNFAKAREFADIDGDGVADGYTSNDVVALRNFLLGRDGYKNTYGDVSGNGATNIGDLAILRRSLVGSYNSVKDGFWRNVELGTVKIYYAENDTQDMARKLELYLESVYPNVDVVKYAGTAVTDESVADKANYASEDNAIVITKTAPTASTYKNYSVNYDKAKNVVTVNGNSFTAVEQAVLDLIAQFKANGNTANPQNISGAISDEKAAKTVNGVTYYYAWGDEFAGNGVDGTVNADTWETRVYKFEGNDLDGKAVSEITNNTRYLNLENPNVDNLKDLWVVSDGKLTIWRGVNTDLSTANMSDISSNDKTILGNKSYTWGYKGIAEGAAGTTTDFNSKIDANDVYVDPGLISTNKSMIFKQGYAEMRASLPSDGHAFPAWWFMTGNTVVHNLSMAQTLYSKVYKLNANYDGTTNRIDPTKLNTYKYQLPQAHLEYDIVEFMQAADSNSTTGKYRDYINLTIHKWYDQNALGDNLYIPNWETYTAGTAISRKDFNNTAGGSGFIHRYNPDKTTAPYKSSYTTGSWFWEKEVTTSASYSIEKAIAASKLTSGKTVTDYYTYGFSWTVSGTNYKLVVYVDFDEDGIMEDGEQIFTVDQNTGHESTYNGDNLGSRTLTDPIYSNGATYGVTDADIWNQYAYMLIDNSYYTSNPTGSNGKVKMYTDLLTQSSGHGTSGATDKTTFDIDYVRVYQQDGRRDLVTKETEAFNLGNHFGY